jgi:hypothetical protein
VTDISHPGFEREEQEVDEAVHGNSSNRTFTQIIAYILLYVK